VLDFGKDGSMMKNYVLLLTFFIFIGICDAFCQVGSDDKDESGVVVLDNFILNDAIKMYPNPVQNFLTIKSSLPITDVQVYSLLGEPVKQIRGNFSRIDLRELNSGIYMIKIHSNQFSVTKKLVKK
jgi:hypothetical protein